MGVSRRLLLFMNTQWVLNLFDTSNFEGLRDKTIFYLFLDTGIRLGEFGILR